VNRAARLVDQGRRKKAQMRVLVLEDWWNLVVSERPDPVPVGKEVLLEIHATGICGSDFHGFTGQTGRRQLGQVMGHETVGRVLALGDDVGPEFGLAVGAVATVNPVVSCGACDHCRAGAEQACPSKSVIGVDPAVSSAFAEKMLAPADNVIPLPDTMPIDYGALIEPLAVGHHAIRRGRIGPDDRVLVIGGGPVGQACLLAAVRQGASRVAVSEPNASRRRLNDALGATTLDLITPERIPAVTEALGGPPTVVVDAVGSSASVNSAFSAAPLGSTIVLVGMGEAELKLRAYEISTKERTIVGSFCYSHAEFKAIAEWVGTGPAELSLLIEGRVGLLEGADAFAALARGDNTASKVLVLPQRATANY
jgi:threonine dehydrogenase-like Zn-dependent dehydrogenase